MGAAVKVTRDDMTAGDLRKACGRVKDGKVARRLLTIRPEHLKADAGAQAAFKKTFAA